MRERYALPRFLWAPCSPVVPVQISRASAAVSSTIERTTEPIRNTAAYKALSDTISDALDDSGSMKHAGFEEKEARRRRRQLRLEKAGKSGMGVRTKANPESVPARPSLCRMLY